MYFCFLEFPLKYTPNNNVKSCFASLNLKANQENNLIETHVGQLGIMRNVFRIIPSKWCVMRLMYKVVEK